MALGVALAGIVGVPDGVFMTVGVSVAGSLALGLGSRVGVDETLAAVAVVMLVGWAVVANRGSNRLEMAVATGFSGVCWEVAWAGRVGAPTWLRIWLAGWMISAGRFSPTNCAAWLVRGLGGKVPSPPVTIRVDVVVVMNSKRAIVR